MAEECGNCRWWHQIHERRPDDGKCTHERANQIVMPYRHDWCHWFDRKELA
jgi:hypothetical protein